MKRFASILLLFILLFNWVGYRMVTSFMEEQASASLTVKLEQNLYNESDLIEVRVPLELPYQTNWNDFERFDGEIEIAGEHFRYVKRKVENGEMVLLCIPNTDRTKLQTARDNFFKLVNDLQHDSNGKEGKDQKTSVNKILTAEYFQETNDWTIDAIRIGQPNYKLLNVDPALPGFTKHPAQPPDFC